MFYYVHISGDKWRRSRKILTPAFHFKILEQFVDTFDSASDVLVDKLKSQSGKSEIDVYPYITLCTLDIICGIFLWRVHQKRM